MRKGRLAGPRIGDVIAGEPFEMEQGSEFRSESSFGLISNHA